MPVGRTSEHAVLALWQYIDQPPLMATSQIPPKVTIKINKRFAQRVDATTKLIGSDVAIRVDHRILVILQNTVRRGMRKPAPPGSLKKPTTLYKRYRGNGFPLKQRNDSPMKRWRYLSQWMKCQIGLLCLGEQRFLQFRLTLHDELLAELEAKRVDLKRYFRDRITRCVREQLGVDAWFVFVIEDRDNEGDEGVRPHIHGSIGIHRAKLHTKKDGSYTVHSERAISKLTLEKAEFEMGKQKLKSVLAVVSGNAGRRSASHNGLKQDRNVWTRDKTHTLFNDAWISYMLKNSAFESKTLPDNRVAMSRGLNQEAQRLWRLVSNGEAAMSQWTSV